MIVALSPGVVKATYIGVPCNVQACGYSSSTSILMYNWKFRTYKSLIYNDMTYKIKPYVPFNHKRDPFLSLEFHQLYLPTLSEGHSNIKYCSLIYIGL